MLRMAAFACALLETVKKNAVESFFDCFWWRSGIDILANSCKFFTYTMWKYIIIAAVVLFLGACFLFYKNNEALTGSEGEVAAFQSQFEMAKKKAIDIEKDKAIKRYAELRTAYFNQLSQKYNEEYEAVKAEDAPYDQEITKANADLEAARSALKEYETKFKEFLKNAADSVGESGDDEETMKVVGQRIAELIEANNVLAAQAEAEEKTTSELVEETAKTMKLAEEARALAAERRSRLSPVDLKCSVLSADSTWDYVILDGGIDKGIVIGSHLAVMRGEQKVCELTVTLVEANRTSCDVIYSTMRPGDKVRPGDTVVSVREK